jgi:hypothetical protein
MRGFFKPFLTYDFVIIISNFFNEEQKRILEIFGANREYMKNLLLHSTIFHELIHVVEACTGKIIFTVEDNEECNKITMPIAERYLKC